MAEKLLSASKCFTSHASHATQEGISHVAESQKSYWRHKCAACAYEAGLIEGKRLAQAATAAEAN